MLLKKAYPLPVAAPKRGAAIRESWLLPFRSSRILRTYFYTAFSEGPTWADIVEIYIRMRNDKKGLAILYVNLKNASDLKGTACI